MGGLTGIGSVYKQEEIIMLVELSHEQNRTPCNSLLKEQYCLHYSFARSAYSDFSGKGLVLVLGAAITKFHGLVACKQQKVISHSSGCWIVQDHGTNIVTFWGRLFQIADSSLLTAPSQGRSGWQALWGLFYKDTDPILEDHHE